jgi:hypothetical protein
VKESLVGVDLALYASFENVGRIIVGLMAVAGAFLIGSILTWMILGGVAKFFLRRAFPTGLMKICRVIGGVVVAIVVASFVFGDGGFGWGPGDAQKGDLGKGEEKKKEEPKKIDPNKEKKEDPLKNKDKEGPPEESVKVTILGGSATDEKFYLFQNERTPRTLFEIRSLILEQREKSVRPLKMVEIYVYQNSADRNGPVVRNLEKWARETNFGVSFPPVQNELRPE